MHLVMFDVDGTLIQSCSYDTELYVKSVKELLDLKEIDSNWARYPHVTTTAILEVIIKENFNRKPFNYEYDLLKKIFYNNLVQYHKQNYQSFKVIDGAKEMLYFLSGQKNIKISLATGSWDDSAFFKLQKSEIDLKNIPISSASDCKIRADIMKNSLKKANDFYDCEFSKVTYVGDGIWDYMSSKELGYTFILVGNKIKDYDTKVDNFLDLNLFYSYLKSF